MDMMQKDMDSLEPPTAIHHGTLNNSFQNVCMERLILRENQAFTKVAIVFPTHIYLDHGQVKNSDKAYQPCCRPESNS
jgi:hypothetical protein